ncbi:MAG: PHB depolymerase family esterase [Bacteroidota bacterium]
MRSLVVLLACLSFSAFGQEAYTFTHKGKERTYYLHLPDNLSSNAPLVFVLHGYTSNAENIMNYSGMAQEADKQGFAVVFPQGTRAINGETFWNAQLKMGISDDIGFLTRLAEYLQETHGLNPEATFACGMSNGGFMSYTLACERPQVFRAIASVTGTMSAGTWDKCQSGPAVPIFQVSGTADETVPMDGSLTTRGGWGGAPKMEEIITFWAERNQTEGRVEMNLGTATTATYYQAGDPESAVWYYVIKDWEHWWPVKDAQETTGFVAAEEIWAFFSQYVD